MYMTPFLSLSSLQTPSSGVQEKNVNSKRERKKFRYLYFRDAKLTEDSFCPVQSW